MEKCIGCELCEKVCEFLNEKARVNISSTIDGVLVPLTCLHCSEAACVKVCPTGAIYKNEEGFVLIKKNKCIGCKLCVMICPLGILSFDSDKGFIIKCDLCQDRANNDLPPACVEVCPAGAINYVEEEKIESSESLSLKLLQKKKVIQKEKKIGGE
ncbi:4Fe-4S dicluster domain-containing protein [Candidatus Bathyarchaeota archaeon]|nr:4Fe-4S dicluster domain-containing protein [Candidatus Bathyarchaeota archaeon]